MDIDKITTETMKKPPVIKSFSVFVWICLGFNLLVVLYGAVVRATGSGAGCGSHWPLCNGVVIPLNQRIETTVEFIHRLTSGLAFLFILVMFIWAFRAYGKRSPVRLAASLSLVFMILEALVGAALVLFGWVGQDTSSSRVLVISIHLVNTFLLLASIALTGWWSSGRQLIVPWGGNHFNWGLGVAILLVLILGVTGAITALGDTLFPTDTLAEGLRQDFDPASHYVIQTRVLHPFLAIVTGAYLILLAINLRRKITVPSVSVLSLGIIILVGVQLLAGMINLILLAPIWLQIIHLLLADLVWINLVLLTAAYSNKFQEGFLQTG